jgi:hypothetical protein
MNKKEKDRHLDVPAEANRDKHINFIAEENNEKDPADEPRMGSLSNEGINRKIKEEKKNKKNR